jgi:hypothetical protein
MDPNAGFLRDAARVELVLVGGGGSWRKGCILRPDHLATTAARNVPLRAAGNRGQEP